MEADRASRSGPPESHLPSNRMPEGSTFYEFIVPALLIVFGVVTVALILFAAGVLLGVIPFQ